LPPDRRDGRPARRPQRDPPARRRRARGGRLRPRSGAAAVRALRRRALPCGRPLAGPREAHSATLLRDGRVLVCGGTGADGRALATAELYDPASDRWSPAGRLGEGRTKHAAVRLPDGRVLLVGGARDRESRGRLASTELYDPAAGRFTPGPRLRAGRYKLPDAVVALPDGRVLVAGDAPEVEIVDPARGRVTLARGDLGAARAFATATRVGADVLVLGGYDERIAIQAGAYLVG